MQLQSLLDWSKTLAERRPWTVILIAAALACMGGYAYVYELDIVSDRAALSNRGQDYYQRFERYKEEFGRQHELLVLAVSAGPVPLSKTAPPMPTATQREAMKGVAARWADSLRQYPDLFPQVVSQMPLSEQNGLAVLYLPLDRLRPAVTALQSTLPMVEEWTSTPSYARLLGLIHREMSELSPADTSTASGAQSGQFLNGLEQFVRWSRQTLSETTIRTTPGASALTSVMGGSALDPEGFFFTEDGRLLTAYTTISGDPSRQNYYEPVLSVAEQELQEALQGVPDSVQVEAGLAGRPAINHEEVETTQRDFARGTLLAFLAVTLLFIWGFRNVARPALAVLCLGFGIGITFLMTWLILGHLNMVAMVFAIILVALGIDFAIHFFTHYQKALADGASPAKAIQYTYRTIGGALWMDGLATASAFWAAYFTEFPGLSELGLIAGSGLLICLVCMVVVYPAMLYLLDTRGPSVSTEMRLRLEAPLSRLMATEQERSGGAIALLVVGMGLAAFGFAGGQYTFDTNLLNLQPTGGEAYQWQQRLLKAETRTAFALATYKDLDSLRAAQEAFEKQPRVAHTESVIPSHSATKRDLLAPVCSTATDLQVGPPPPASVPDVQRQLFRIRQTLRSYQQASAAADSALAPLSDEVTALYRQFQSLSPPEGQARLHRIQEQMARSVREVLPHARTLFCPPPFSMDRVPSYVRDRFVGKGGTYALQVYPAGNSWEESTLESFLQQARSVDANLFGLLVNFYESAQSMIRSFAQSALYSSVVIVVLLLLWTRSVRATMLALLPLVAGIGVLLGVMEWVPYSLEWNFANFFALPILIGVGVASGVHLVQAWRTGDLEVFRSAVRAVVFSALTTMIGFGLLALSAHLGIRSLGVILLLGITLNLIACLALLPTALRLFASSSNLLRNSSDTDS